MFKKDHDGDIILELQDKSFKIENPEEYKEFVIYLTDPRIEAREIITDTDLLIHESLESNEKRFCEKCAEFINKFEEERRTIIEENSIHCDEPDEDI